ncbi:helix-turn-helix transcriptional regulator [Leucobacter sp. GX24907]
MPREKVVGVARDLTSVDRVLLLFNLVPYLRERGPTPIVELAETFGVEPAELRSLFRFLGTAGVPGETLTYQPEDLFDIDWDALEHEDLASLVRPVVVEEVPRFAPVEAAALIAGLQALTSMLPADDAELAARTAAKLGEAFAVPSDAAALSISVEPQDERLPMIVEALRVGVALEFTYRDGRGTETERRVSPMRLQQGADAWYLRGVCHDRGEERTFRVDRMRRLAMLDEPALLAEPATLAQRAEPADSAKPQRAPLAAPAPEKPASVRSAGDAVTVEARVREWALSRISGFEPELLAVPAEEGWVRVRVELGHVDAAIRLVEHALGEVVVEAPDEAREAVRCWAEEALAYYDE